MRRVKVDPSVPIKWGLKEHTNWSRMAHSPSESGGELGGQDDIVTEMFPSNFMSSMRS